MIKIIVDSTAYTPKEYADANDITVIPLRVLYKGNEFDEGYPGSYDEFFEDFTKTKVFPKTSQPSLEKFIEEYNKAIDKGDEVLVFTISSTLSGTYSVACLAKDQCKDPSKVYVVDSQGNTQTILGYVMEAVNMRKTGATCKEIIARIEELIPNSCVSFIPDSLEYLVKGGRIGKVSATIGTILQIRPIITFKKGVLSDKKSFGMQKAMKDLIATIPQKLKRLFIIHIADTKFFDNLKKLVYDSLAKRPDKDEIEVYEGEIGPVNAAHVGPAVGLAWIAE